MLCNAGISNEICAEDCKNVVFFLVWDISPFFEAGMKCLKPVFSSYTRTISEQIHDGARQVPHLITK